MTVTVGIVSWKVMDELAACLDSLQPQLKDGDRVVIVDNDSRDGTVELIRERYPWCQLHANRENVHYARGMNQALSGAETDLVMALNPDTVPAATALEAARRVLLDRRVGAVGFEIQNRHGETVSIGRDRPTLAATVGRWLLPTRLIDGLVSAPRRGRRGPVLVRGLSGAAFVMRRSRWNELGGFDVALPLYAEDIDLFARVRDSGLKLICLAGVPVSHAEGASLGQVPASQRAAYLGQLVFHLLRGEGTPWLPRVLGLALWTRAAAWRISARLAAGARRRDALVRAQHYDDVRARIPEVVRDVDQHPRRM